MSQARLREALTASGPNAKDRGQTMCDGVLTVTPDTPEALEWRSRRSVIDTIASCSDYLREDDEGAPGFMVDRVRCCGVIARGLGGAQG